MDSKAFAAALCLILCPGTGALAATHDLPVEAGLWSKKIFLQPGSSVSEDEAATLAIVDDPVMGPALSVGPWVSGRWGVRYQFEQPFAFTTGTVRGAFRSEGLAAHGLEVSVSWYQGSTRLHKITIPLGAADNWQTFELPIRNAYPGADSMSLGFGLSAKTNGRALFADITLDDSYAALDAATLPALTRPAPPAALAPATSVELIDDNGTWWLVSADGEPFYARGTHGPNWTKGDNVVADYFASLLQGAGFNTLGGWSSIYRWREANEEVLLPRGDGPLYVFQTENLSDPTTDYSHLENALGESTGGSGHAFPDPFDPDFVAYVNARYADRFTLVEDTPWFVGWSPDNEATHDDLQRYVYSAHASLAFRDFLSERYGGSIGALNSAWATAFASFDDILAQKPDPEGTAGPGYDDFSAFAVEIVREYVQVLEQAVAAGDTQHLVFSPQLALGDYTAWEPYLDIYAASFDAIMINMYPENALYGLSDGMREILDHVHAVTGKPIFVTEWSVPALDSGLYDDPDMLDFSWSKALATQAERAEHARTVTYDFYNLPYVVGTHWFKWLDYDDANRRANRGLSDTDGFLYVELWDALTDAHAALVAHESAPPGGNAPPLADAGADQTLIDSDGDGQEIVQLDGSGSTDPDGDPLSYEWREGGAVIASGATPAVPLAVGQHDITLSVSDGEAPQSSDAVRITVDPAPPPPTLAAPSNLTATVGGNGIALAWSDNSANEDGFRLFSGKKRKGSITYSLVATLGADATGFLDAAEADGQRYYVEAFIVVPDITSDPSNTVTAKAQKGGGRKPR